MRYRRFGRTGLRVSLLGLGSGGNSLLGQSRGRDQGATTRLVGRALELGVNLIDTSPLYGSSERLLGAALAGVPRSSYVLCSKFWPARGGKIYPPDALRASFEGSLRDLKTDYVDVFYLHGVRPEELQPGLDTLGPVVEDFKRQGLARHLGITEAFTDDHGHEMMPRAIPLGLFDVAMVGYNLMSPAPARTVFPLAQQHDTGVVVMCAVRGALLKPERIRQIIREWKRDGRIAADAADGENSLSWVQGPGVASITDAAYKFAAAPPAVSSVLTGTASLEHLEANAWATIGPPLPAEVVERAHRLFGPVSRNVDR